MIERPEMTAARHVRYARHDCVDGWDAFFSFL